MTFLDAIHRKKPVSMTIATTHESILGHDQSCMCGCLPPIEDFDGKEPIDVTNDGKNSLTLGNAADVPINFKSDEKSDSNIKGIFDDEDSEVELG
eukprot:CAMPEP_0178750270 /NCGR_PEP_ID=MMETSP0744-20121128/9880_1 /TAXON_ID=913974 /ORGANISM="Nitzschia punctata, Strain CCMP561" /LENGTH=94 /DNA_ID=CAMNT_0020403791 /DNA_START=1 /DNA_END=281 /DNA_ORIENTATION=-